MRNPLIKNIDNPSMFIQFIIDAVKAADNGDLRIGRSGIFCKVCLSYLTGKTFPDEFDSRPSRKSYYYPDIKMKDYEWIEKILSQVKYGFPLLLLYEYGITGNTFYSRRNITQFRDDKERFYKNLGDWKEEYEKS